VTPDSRHRRRPGAVVLGALCALIAVAVGLEVEPAAARPRIDAPAAVARAAAPAATAPCPRRTTRRARRCAPVEQRSPFTLTFLEGSVVTLDRAGQSTLRFPLSGTMHGYTIGRVGFINVVRSRLTRANLRPAATDVLTDTACGGVPTAAIRTSPSARITFDPRHTNVSSLDARTAVFSSTTWLRIRVPLELRNPRGCGLPPVTTGYADTFDHYRVTGTFGTTTRVDSPRHPVTVKYCLTPGPPNRPCAGRVRSTRAQLQVHYELRTSFP